MQPIASCADGAVSVEKHLSQVRLVMGSVQLILGAKQNIFGKHSSSHC